MPVALHKPSATESVKSRGHLFQPERKLKVVCIGAGASGLLLTYKIQRHFSDIELEVYEKNPDVSGTWFENRYPGCACDVPAHCYTWSFEPKTDWSANYASSREIFKYFKDFAAKNQLDRFIQLEHEAIGASWNKETAQWHVKVKDLKSGQIKETACDVLINACGILNSWRYPSIPGLMDFKGELVHSASWPEKLNIAGKIVGLIGNGSSGIQILPAVKAEASQLITFIRSPTWIAPPVGQGYMRFTDEDKALFAADPEYHLKLRKEIEAGMNSVYPMFHADSDVQKGARTYMRSTMEAKLQNKDFEEKLIPDWPVGCRRITPGTNYLESLNDKNVKVVFGEITQITETGVICNDGKAEHSVDVLICATGFDTTFKPRWPLTGPDGKQLGEYWKDEPKSYFGIAAAKFPNYLFTLGPNCPVGNGPVLIGIEAEVEYMIKILAKMQKEHIATFEVNEEVVDDFVEWKDNYMKGTVWTHECHSWYKAGSAAGKVLALWPGSTLHYIETMRSPRWEDWTFKSSNENRFSFLGNGFSSAEATGGDLSYYVRNADDSHIDPILKPDVKIVNGDSKTIIGEINMFNGESKTKDVIIVEVNGVTRASPPAVEVDGSQ